MFVDQILYPVETLGPGKRIAIWLVGCKRACPGCSNPELWSTEGRLPVPVEALLQSIARICSDNPVDGFTITGGEPMLQANELLELVEGLAALNSDILVFSGFTYEELEREEVCSQVLSRIAVLVDGPYVEEKNERLILRGSSNQRVLLLNPALEARYRSYLEQGHSSVQNLYFEDETISIGIHDQHFQEDLTEKLRMFHIKRKENP